MTAHNENNEKMAENARYMILVDNVEEKYDVCNHAS